MYHLDSASTLRKSKLFLNEKKLILKEHKIISEVKIVDKEFLLQEGLCKDSGLFVCFYAHSILEGNLDVKNPDIEVQILLFGRKKAVVMRSKFLDIILENGKVIKENKDLILDIMKT